MPKKKKKKQTAGIMIPLDQPEGGVLRGGSSPQAIETKPVRAFGGYQPNAGTKKGKLWKSTIKKREAERRYEERAMRAVHNLANAQLATALGNSYLMRIDKDEKGKDMRPVIVQDPEEITQFLSGELDNADCYYHITTDKPDTRAIDSIFDRLFGKATQKVTAVDGNDNPVELNMQQAVIIAGLFAANKQLTDERDSDDGRNDRSGGDIIEG